MSPCSQDRSGGGKPLWLRRRLPSGPEYEQVRQLLRTRDLHTVCQEAHCPNQFECYARGTATFMILGDRCSRSCRFCAVRHEPPGPLDPDEPERVAEAVALLDLRYAVITSVDQGRVFPMAGPQSLPPPSGRSGGGGRQPWSRC